MDSASAAVPRVHRDDGTIPAAGEAVLEVARPLFGYVEAREGAVEVPGVVLLFPDVPVGGGAVGIGRVLRDLTVGEVALGALVGIGFGLVALEHSLDLVPGAGCLLLNSRGGGV
jgi:hypothetical protein